VIHTRKTAKTGKPKGAADSLFKRETFQNLETNCNRQGARIPPEEKTVAK